MLDKKRSRADWPIWLVVVILLVVPYTGAYVWMIEPANGHWGYGAGPGSITEVPPEYWFDSGLVCGANCAFFWPAHEIDKWLRYDFWHVPYPQVRDIPP